MHLPGPSMSKNGLQSYSKPGQLCSYDSTSDTIESQELDLCLDVRLDVRDLDRIYPVADLCTISFGALHEACEDWNRSLPIFGSWQNASSHGGTRSLLKQGSACSHSDPKGKKDQIQTRPLRTREQDIVEVAAR